jgi:hypothetical protein
MLYYEDIILAERPWSHCPLNEPIDCPVFLDSTGNGNHLYSKRALVNGEWVYTSTTTNQIDVPIPNSLSAKGTRLIGNTITHFNSIRWDDITDPKMFFDIPIFKSDVIFYRNRVKIQSLLTINHLWIEMVLMDLAPSFEYSTVLNGALSPLYAVSGQTASVDSLLDDDDLEYLVWYSGEQASMSLSVGYSFSVYELQMIIGPCHVFFACTHYFDPTGFSYRQTLRLEFYMDRTLVYSMMMKDRLWDGTNFNVTEPNDFTGAHRLTLGVTQTSQSEITLIVSLDGEEQTQTPWTTTTNLSDYETYSRVEWYGVMKISNVALYFHKPFPSNSWLSSTQQAFLDDRYIQHLETQPNTFRQDDHPFPRMVNERCSYIRLIDAMCFIGSKHTKVKAFIIQQDLVFSMLAANITPSPTFTLNDELKVNSAKQLVTLGIWRVQSIGHGHIVIEPSITAFNQIRVTFNGVEYSCEGVVGVGGSVQLIVDPNHLFRVGEYVMVDAFHPVNLDQIWTVTGTQNGALVISYPTSPIEQSDTAVIKKIGFGGIRVWDREQLNDSQVKYSAKALGLHHQHLLIDDNQSKKYATANLCNIDASIQSPDVTFFKSLKHAFSSPVAKDNRFVAIGDPYRFYFFVDSKTTSVSTNQIYAYGAIAEILDPTSFSSFIIGYNSNGLDVKLNHNLAFQYPAWSILNSGHLLCQSISSDAKSGTQSNYQGSSTTVTQDGAYHIYPDNYLFDN